jgi:hypothetical protein
MAASYQVSAWVPTPSRFSYTRSPREIYQSVQDDSLQRQKSGPQSDLLQVNGETSTLMTTAGSSKSQLFSAFSALDLNDQYDAVLTGLCANKILDDSGVAAADARQSLQDPLQLLDEMNDKQIQASPRSLMALIDVSTVQE